MNKKTIKDIDLKGKKVFVRCDFNVPMDENGNITDSRRIEEALSTINYLKDQGCKIILSSHMGRPKGEFNPKYSLKPVAKKLSELLGQEVEMADDVVGESAQNLAANLKNGQIMLLENTRFHREETDNDPEFAKKLASMADVFVNDAFGTAHRAHASTEGITHYLPSVAGLLMEKELNFLGNALNNPERPFDAILGGSKVSDKIAVIDSLIEKAKDPEGKKNGKILIGGGMAYTFFKALGYEVGNSLCEPEKCKLALELMKKARQNGVKLVLPEDTVIGKELSSDTETKEVLCSEIPEGWAGFDIGPKTVELFGKELKDAKTVIWNGPLGAFETKPFNKGTKGIAEALAELENATTIIGGGDSAAAVEETGLSDKMTHISTGGGASLEFIEGKKLPGVESLEDKEPEKKKQCKECCDEGDER